MYKSLRTVPEKFPVKSWLSPDSPFAPSVSMPCSNLQVTLDPPLLELMLAVPPDDGNTRGVTVSLSAGATESMRARHTERRVFLAMLAERELLPVVRLLSGCINLQQRRAIHCEARLYLVGHSDMIDLNELHNECVMTPCGRAELRSHTDSECANG